MHSLKIIMMATAAMLTTGIARADVISLTSGDIGKEFVIDYDARLTDGTPINDFKARTVFALTSVNGNNYSFDYWVVNGSRIEGPIVTGFGFNTSPGLVGASSTGQFFGTPIIGPNVPNVGRADVCFAGYTAPGRPDCADGGLPSGDGTRGTMTLRFGSVFSSIKLSDFFVSYGDSAVGTGKVQTGSSGGTPVPEPADLVLFAIGTAGLMFGRRRAMRAHRAV